MIKRFLLLIFFALVLIAAYFAYVFLNRGDLVWLIDSEDMSIRVEEIVTLPGVPWGIDLLDENTMIVTVRSGNIGLIDLSSGAYSRLYQVSDLFHLGECGLHDVRKSPSFERDRLVYFSYAKNIDGNGFTSLAIAKIDQGSLSGWTDLFVSKHEPTDDWRHCGSRIDFNDNNYLFMSIGDRGQRKFPQDLSTHGGKIIRLHLDGSVPEDNPFVSVAGALPEIWSLGHRNPQGLAYDAGNQRLWSNEHGPRGGDEVNLIDPGKNYGWPIAGHGREYASSDFVAETTERPGMENPLKIWSPSIAPSALLVYQGDKLPGWRGNLFSTALVQKHLNRLVVDGSGRIIFEERLLEELKERFRSIIQNDAGDIFLSTDNGRILKLSPADNESILRWNLFRHLDMPGFYLSFDVDFMLSK